MSSNDELAEIYDELEAWALTSSGVFRVWLTERLREIDSAKTQRARTQLILELLSLADLQINYKPVRRVYGKVLGAFWNRFTKKDEDTELARRIEKDSIRKMKTAFSGLAAKAAARADLQAVAPVARVTAKVVQEQIIGGELLKTTTSMITDVVALRGVLEVRRTQEIQGDKALYFYRGPRDNRNRPFCRKVLDGQKQYSLAEIKAFDSDPLISLTPVLIYCGGWGCRHTWIAVNPEKTK